MIKSRLTTIEDLQAAISQAIDLIPMLSREGRLPPELAVLAHLAPPEELAAKVSMRHVENDRQIKSSASVASWVPGACGIWVEYAVRDSTSTSEQVTPQVRSLILELDAAERVPGKRFIAWKWFVDSYLPGRIWKYSREETQETLQRLVAGGWLQTNKVENPKNPAFPTATLSISREHPEVRRLLELGGAAARFMPMEIRGEPLSESIIRDRR